MVYMEQYTKNARDVKIMFKFIGNTYFLEETDECVLILCGIMCDNFNVVGVIKQS
jgi:hypothetical protein